MKIIMYNIYKIMRVKGITLLLLLLVAASCQKTNMGTDEGVYPNTRTPAAVKFLATRVSPASGNPGISVTVPVSGLDGKQGQFKAFIGATEVPVTAVSATQITITVPTTASSGNITVLLNNEYFYGPNFTVNGKVYIDPDFNTNANQASGGTISGIIPYYSNYILYGSFTQYGGLSSSCSGMAYINDDGSAANFQPYFGDDKSLKLSPGYVFSMAQLDDGNFLMGGAFSSVALQKDRILGNLNGVARLFTYRDHQNYQDQIDTAKYRVPNADPHNYPERSWLTGSAINGGAEGGAVLKVFQTNDGAHYIAVGNFNRYVTTYYPGSTWNAIQQDRIEMRQLFSMRTDGGFDSAFNYNYATKKSYPATNALINDAVQAGDGNIIMVGSFTTYNGNMANHIVKVDAYTGQVDPSFNTGSGFDGIVASVKYNPVTKHYMVTGLFNNYNGMPAKNMVMLNEDGTMNTDFTARAFGTGLPTFVKQLNSGRIICAGTFTLYDGVSRPGFAILNADGSLAVGYNNTGNFNGFIADAIETTSKITLQPAVFLVGSFSRFDATQVSNIVKIVVEN